MLALSLAVGVALTAARPQGVAEDPVEVLEELAGRVASLESFRARYRMRQPDEEDRVVELAYAAPDRLRVDLVGGESGRGVRMWSVRGELRLLATEREGEPTWASIDLGQLDERMPAALERLEDCLPDEGEDRLAPGPRVEARWHLDPRTDEVEFQLALSWIRGRRGTLLGWLDCLKDDPGLLSVGPEELVQQHARFTASVSRTTGFLSELSMLGVDGREVELRLEELDLQPELEASLFELPARPADARDVSDSFAQSIFAHLRPDRLRRTCLGRIDRQLAGGRVEWTASTRDCCREVLRALYEPTLRDASARYLESTEDYVDRLYEWIRQARLRGRTAEELREKGALERSKIVATLDGTLEKWLEGLTQGVQPGARSDHWRDLLELEREVFGELFDELYRRPVLEDFDAGVDEALEG